MFDKKFFGDQVAKSKKKIILFAAAVALIGAGVYGGKYAVNYREFQKAAEAAGSFPYQVGVTNAIITKCTTSCCSAAGCRCCMGGTLCTTIPDETNCVLYSDINGTSAGGSGEPPLLLSNVAIGQAGLTSGGQLIYGGMTNSMYMSANAVLASSGGCYGCK